MNLIGREWSRKVNCYTLIQDYFSDVGLPDIKFKLYKPEFFLATAQEHGFIQVSLDNIKPDDVIITNSPVHLLIYLGENKVLHHPICQLSRKENINQEMLDNIKYIVRRK